MRIIPSCSLLLAILLCETVHAQNFLTTIIEKNMPEDALLNFTQLTEKYGYVSEEYEVVTDDGYILKLFRIKGDPERPVFLMHGLFDSSDTFMIRGNTSLGITLADQGYDVWFGNNRGNKYSRRHQTLDPDKDVKAFWDFSFHELGVLDVPAMLDFILNVTDKAQVPVFGHSQGNLIFYVLGSERPEYNDKVSVLVALNPICRLRNVREFVKVIMVVWPIVSPVLGLLGVEELFRVDTLLNNVTKAFCSQSFGYNICGKGVVFPTVGRNYDELEKEFFPVVIGHYLAGTSRRVADHQRQLARKVFAQFDYGFLRNLRRYKSAKPPPYNLKNVVMPVAMLATLNDNIGSIEDVRWLRGELPNVVHYQEMEPKELNHVDLIWGKNMKDYFYPVAFDILNKYANFPQPVTENNLTRGTVGDAAEG